MGKILVDVLDAAGIRLGSGPVKEIQSISIDRQLDGAGTFKISAAVSARSIELFTNERRVKIYHEDAGGLRLMGQGIIEDVNIVDNPTGISLKVSGPDILDELARKTTLLARIYNQQTVQTVVNSLITLVPGWSASIDAGIVGNVIDARYDGASVLKALRDIVGRYGYHFRLSSSDKVVSISQFGEDSGERVFKTQVITTTMLKNPKLLFVQNLPEKTSTKDLINWIVPLGAGEGTGALTLEKSTRSSPYTVQSIAGPDGTLQYYLSDATSVAAYGQIEKMLTFKQIAPLSNSETDIINAANALYDAAADWLTKNKNPIVTYGLTVKNVKNNILPGDKIHVNYKGQIITPRDETVDYLSIRDDFWVMRAIERVGLDQHSVDLEISNVDQRVMNVVERVADSMEDIKLRDLKPDISSTTRSYVYDREMDSSLSATIPLEFTDATLSLQRIRLRLKTTPFRSTASGAASGGGSSVAGGDHNHRLSVYLGIGTPNVFNIRHLFRVVGGGFASLFVGGLSLDTTGDLETYDASGDHTHSIAHSHTLTYAINDDSVSPKNVTVWVNGVDKTTELFGFTPLAPTGANLDVVADVGELTNLILNAGGGLRQEHTIEVKCANQQGRIEATMEIFETNQSVNII